MSHPFLHVVFVCSSYYQEVGAGCTYLTSIVLRNIYIAYTAPFYIYSYLLFCQTVQRILLKELDYKLFI